MLSWYFVMDLIMLGIKPKTMRPFVIADHSARAILLFTLWHWPHSSNTMQRKILMIIEPSLLLRQSSSLTRNVFWHWGHLFVTVHLYFTFTQQNWTREALLMQSDLFYPLNHHLKKLQTAKAAYLALFCLAGSYWATMGVFRVVLRPSGWSFTESLNCLHWIC